MNNSLLKYFFPLGCLLVFLAAAIFYCSPVMSGKSLLQPDIIKYRGAAKEIVDYQKENDKTPYWSNSMFGGMPTYQNGAQYSPDLIKKIDGLLRFLPRPADYIFLLFAGFFVLGLTLLKDWKYAMVGSIFFALGAYFFIIIAAGHNAKVHAIAYFAPFVAGILLIFRKQYLLGFLLTTLGLGLELAANHPQMTYYLGLGLLVLGVIKGFEWIKKKEFNHLLKSVGLLALALVIALGMNANRYLTTYEYSKHTIRGKSELTLKPNTETDGLSKAYITNWSYGITETLNLLVPNLMGGSSGGQEVETPEYEQQVRKIAGNYGPEIANFLASHSSYWGEQPITSGPAYQGVVVIFFFFLAIFFIKKEHKTLRLWLFIATALSIVLAWGKNFGLLTNFMIDYFPLYDKFRAVSTALVLAEFTMPLLAILTLYAYLENNGYSPQNQLKKLMIFSGVFIGFLGVLYLFGGSIFDFTSAHDGQLREQILSEVQQYQSDQIGLFEGLINDLQKAMLADRIALMKADVGRAILFSALCFIALWAYTKNWIKQKWVVALFIGSIALMDMWNVNQRYLNEDHFVSSVFVNNPYPTQLNPKLEREASEKPVLAQMAQLAPYNAELQTLKEKDKGYYRVYNSVFGAFNETNTSYFHHSVGGYHGAKLRLIQDVINLYFTPGSEEEFNLQQELGTYGKDSIILYLLNTKYIMEVGSEGLVARVNPNAFGAAKLVHSVQWVENANDEILALKDFDPENEVVLRKSLYGNKIADKYQKDTLATIELTSYNPERLTYKTNSSTPQIAVFSEMYYPEGWQLYIDDVRAENPIMKANYFMRAAEIPAGSHTVEMRFEPKSVATGNLLSTLSFVVFALTAIGVLFWEWRNRDKTKDSAEIAP